MATLQEAVAYFLAERDDFIRAIDNCPASNMKDYWRWQGHAEARRVFRDALERDGIDLMAEPRPEATVKAEALREAAKVWGSEDRVVIEALLFRADEIEAGDRS